MAVVSTLVVVLLAWLLEMAVKSAWRRWKHHERGGWEIEGWRNWAWRRGDKKRMGAIEVLDEDVGRPLLG